MAAKGWFYILQDSRTRARPTDDFSIILRTVEANVKQVRIRNFDAILYFLILALCSKIITYRFKMGCTRGTLCLLIIMRSVIYDSYLSVSCYLEQSYLKVIFWSTCLLNYRHHLFASAESFVLCYISYLKKDFFFYSCISFRINCTWSRIN